MLVQLLVVTLAAFITPGYGYSYDEFWPHSHSSGTQNNNNLNVSNSGVPHLPFIRGWVGTHATYRFLTIIEQTAWVVGEPKHGLWRFQENGLIREYRKKGKKGLPDGVNPHDPNLTAEQKQIIRDNYAPHLPGEGPAGYKFPDERISNGDGSYDDQKGYLNFIDLSMYHLKYDGIYNSHIPIDLPVFYCLISQANFPHVWNSWNWAVKQPMANKISPLGIRAGLDVKENYKNVLQIRLVDDAGLWANIGNHDGAGNDKKIENLDDLKTRAQNVNYQRVSFDKMNVETYLVERMFFNEPHMFVIIIMENKEGPSDFSFIRNDGQYWEDLQKFQMVDQLKTKNHVASQYPYMWVDNRETSTSDKKKVFGLPVYGHHHPDREAHGLAGGACPEIGGDIARYPYGNAGGAFPTNYQEISPMCDGLCVDMKFTANLWVETWNDPALVLGNAAYNSHVVNYKVDKGVYGRYTDPYLVDKNEKNPVMMDLTEDGKIIKQSETEKHEKVVLKLNYTYPSKLIEYNLAELRSNLPPDPDCPTEPADCPQIPEEKQCATGKFKQASNMMVCKIP